MRKSILKYSAILCALFTLLIVLLKWDYILYHYYMWRLKNTSEGALILELNESITRLGSSAVPFLINTFKDEKVHLKNRHAATLAIVKADRQKAENLFVEYLKSGNDSQVSESILGLSELGSLKYYDDIVKLAESSNNSIRANVAMFLGLKPTEKSKRILSKLSSDDDSYVRFWAKESLEKIGKVGREQGSGPMGTSVNK